MKQKPLAAYFILLTLLSAGFIIVMKSAGQQANALAALYMVGPALAAAVTRLLFYKKKFKDAHLRFRKLKDYLKFWAISLGITALSYGIYTLFGSVQWDTSGHIFLEQLTKQFALTGQNINDLPAGFTPQMMLILYSVGGLTVFNILPGIITGFGEEFGWRGFMYPELRKIKPWVAIVIGGLIWYAWHLPLTLVLPQTSSFTTPQLILNDAVLAVGAICTHTYLAYVYVRTKNIWVASVAHITLDNAARSFSYFCVVTNQLTANIGLTVAMVLVVAVLYCSKETKVLREPQ